MGQLQIKNFDSQFYSFLRIFVVTRLKFDSASEIGNLDLIFRFALIIGS